MKEDDYVPLSIDGSTGEMTKEEQLALALNVSVDTALEEQVSRVASLLFYGAPGGLPIL